MGYLLACVLAIVTALALILSAQSFPSSSALSSTSRQDDAARTVAIQFYDALNALLTEGDPAPLRLAARPDLIEHPTPVGVEPGVEGLVRSTLALRATAPSVRLQVDAVTIGTAGTLATVQLTVTGASPASFLGSPAVDDASSFGWGPIEMLRIDGSRVVERWTNHERTALLEPLAAATLPDVDPSAPRLFALFRLSMTAGTTLGIANDFATHLYVAETGRVDLTNADPFGTTLRKASLCRMSIPDSSECSHEVVTPSGSRSTLSSTAEERASVLLLIRYGAGSVRSSTRVPDQISKTMEALRETPGLEAELLGYAALRSERVAAIQFGRVVLDAGGSFEWRSGSVRAAFFTGEADSALEQERAFSSEWTGSSLVVQSSLVTRMRSTRAEPVEFFVLTVT